MCGNSALLGEADDATRLRHVQTDCAALLRRSASGATRSLRKGEREQAVMAASAAFRGAAERAGRERDGEAAAMGGVCAGVN